MTDRLSLIPLLTLLIASLIRTATPGYLQTELPNVVLTKDEIFSLDLNEYFQMNSPKLDIPSLALRSQLDWNIKSQYNPIHEFEARFTMVKALPIASSPYIVFLSGEGLYLYEFINSKTEPSFLEALIFSNASESLKGKSIECFDTVLLDPWRMVVDCNARSAIGLHSVFIEVELEEDAYLRKTMRMGYISDYQVGAYLDYMLKCPRKIYAYNRRILQFCKYDSLTVLSDYCFRGSQCSNQIILWELNENKMNFLLILDEFTLNLPKTALPLKIQEVLINWLSDTLMILDLKRGVYQFDFSNLKLKQEKFIEFNDDYDTVYLGMEIIRMRRRLPLIEVKHYLIVWSNKYIVEVLLKDQLEFYFAKRYDFHYFLGSYLTNTSGLLFGFPENLQKHKLALMEITLKGIQINNNFINLEVEIGKRGEVERYQMIFCRKQNRIAIHYMRRLMVETSFLRVNFLYDEGDYYLEMVKGEGIWRLIEITDLYLVLDCCPLPLISRIYLMKVPLQITTQISPDSFTIEELQVALIPMNYPHVLPATKQPSFQFDDPVIYIKLADIAFGPEIEFLYLSGSNENVRLSIDHIHQQRLDVDGELLEKLLGCEIVAGWIDNENFALRLVFKYNQGSSFRLLGLYCLNVSRTYIGDCRLLPHYDSVSFQTPMDFFLELPFSSIYLHEVSSDHLSLFTPDFVTTLSLTPTKVYSQVLFSPPSLIFAVPDKNNSLEVYYIPQHLVMTHQTEKILNVDAHYLGLSFDLNISQVDLSLVREGIIILVSRMSESVSNVIVLQIVQTSNIPPRFSIRLASVLQIGPCQILALKTKKLILVCDDMITEMRLNNPFYADRMRNYPLYRYNLVTNRKAFTDDKLIYVYASYYSSITMSVQPVLLVYDPDKTSASVLVTTITLASTVSLALCGQVKTELSIMAISYIGDYVIGKNKVRQKNSGVFLNMITLQPALTGVFWFKNEEKTPYKKENEKAFEINVSFTNENSNRDLVSTLNIKMNLKDYNIFLANKTLNNGSVTARLSKKNRRFEFIDSSFFKGPIEEYELTNAKTSGFVVSLTDFLSEGTVLADYQESLYGYGLVLDMISTNKFIIVLSQYRLIIYSAERFPEVFYQERVIYQNDSCRLAHHNKNETFLLSCFNSFDLLLYRYDFKGRVTKTKVQIPNYVGLISDLVAINGFLFIQTHLFNTMNETEFCVCEFPEYGATNSLRVLGIVNSEDFELMNVKSQDFELLELNSSKSRFAVFIVQTYQILYLEITVNEDKTLTKSNFAMAANPFNARFTSISIDSIVKSPGPGSGVFEVIGLIGTDEHLYELNMKVDPARRKIELGESLFVYRKYCKCQNLASKPVKFSDYVARICSYNFKDRGLTTGLFKEETKDLYHFIQVYKRVESQSEAHPIRVIKVLYSPTIKKLFLFYRNSSSSPSSLHLLTASYLNYLVEYQIHKWMGLGIYFLRDRGEELPTSHELTILAKNDFSAQEVNITVLLLNEDEDQPGGGAAQILWIVWVFLLILAGVGVVFWLKKRKLKLEKMEKHKAAEPDPLPRFRILNNIELRYVD